MSTIFLSLTLHAYQRKGIVCPRKLSSIGRDNAYYKQGPGFEPRPLPKKERELFQPKVGHKLSKTISSY